MRELLRQCNSSLLWHCWLPNTASGGNFVEKLRLVHKSIFKKNLNFPNKINRSHTHPLILAHAMKIQLDSGEVNSKAEIARKLGWSRARVTQIMNLLMLPEEVQVLLLKNAEDGYTAISERSLRRLLKAEAPEEREHVLSSLGLSPCS